MATWPSITDPSEFQESIKKGQIKAKFEDGTVLSRAKETRARRRFILGWKSIDQTDYDSLVTFFIANIGTTFTWIHTLSDESVTVRFAKDELPKAKWMGWRGGVQAYTINGLELEED